MASFLSRHARDLHAHDTRERVGRKGTKRKAEGTKISSPPGRGGFSFLKVLRLTLTKIKRKQHSSKPKWHRSPVSRFILTSMVLNCFRLNRYILRAHKRFTHSPTDLSFHRNSSKQRHKCIANIL